MTELLIALISFLGIITPIAVKLYLDIRKEKAKNKELNKILLSSSLIIDIQKLNVIKDIVNNIMINSNIDRFMLLSGVNGKDPVNHVSVLMEQHNYNTELQFSIGATSKYVDIRTDTHYKNMLRNIEEVGSIDVVVSELPDSIFRSIYTQERIKRSFIFFTKRLKVDDKNDRLLYCSWATHDIDYVDPSIRINIESANNMIAQILD